jgi:hypothetical protein
MIKTPTEGVLYDNYVQAHLILVPRPLLEHGRPQGWQIVLKLPMGFEEWPEDIGHGEDDANERYIW